MLRRAELYDIIALQLDIERDYKISTTQYTFLFLAFYVSSILTGMFVGFIADSCGRRPVLMILYLINVVGFILNLISAYKLSYAWLLAGRLIAG